MEPDRTILHKLELFSPEDRQKVVALVEQLAGAKPQRPRKDPLGMFAHHGIDMPWVTADQKIRVSQIPTIW